MLRTDVEGPGWKQGDGVGSGRVGEKRWKLDTYAGRAEMKGRKREAARPVVRSVLWLRRTLTRVVGREDSSESNIRVNTAMLDDHLHRG